MYLSSTQYNFNERFTTGYISLDLCIIKLINQALCIRSLFWSDIIIHLEANYTLLIMRDITLIDDWISIHLAKTSGSSVIFNTVSAAGLFKRLTITFSKSMKNIFRCSGIHDQHPDLIPSALWINLPWLLIMSIEFYNDTLVGNGMGNCFKELYCNKCKQP